jgi:hypothetical protein
MKTRIALKFVLHHFEFYSAMAVGLRGNFEV